MKLNESLFAAMRLNRDLGALALVQLIADSIDREVTASCFVMAFKSAFPEIPLKTLQVASSWVGLGGRSLDDFDFEEMVNTWLKLDRSDISP
jgi:hypothetical protein